MATSTHTQLAVLGALSIAPMTGYALREEIRETLGHFWSESFGQIYPALADLEGEGMVERQHAQNGRSSKFAITEAGTALLRELLAEPPQRTTPRNGLLLRLFFGRQLGPEACRRLVLDARHQAEAQLVGLTAARDEILTEGGADAPYILLTVAAGEHAARAAIVWADEALAALDGLSVPAAQARTRSTKEPG